jgi:hypothetical protein
MIGRRCRAYANSYVDLPLRRYVKVSHGEELLLLVVERVKGADPSIVRIVFEATAVQASNRDAHGDMRVLGLLKPGVTLSQACSDLDTIMQRLALGDPGPEDDHHVFAEFLTEQ